MGRKSKDFTLRPKKGKGKASKVQSDPEPLLRRIRPDIFQTKKEKRTRRLSKRILKGVDKILSESKQPVDDHFECSSLPSHHRSCLKSTERTGEKRVTFKDVPPTSEDSSSIESGNESTVLPTILDSDDEELLPIEVEAQRDQIMEEEDRILEKMEVEEQMGEECRGVEVDFGQSGQSLEDIKVNITNILYVLDDFKVRREEGRARREYVQTLVRDLSQYYSYNEYLMTQFFDLFHRKVVDFLEACEVRRPTVIRTNTIKAKRKELAQGLISRGVNVDPLGEWSSSGLVVCESHIPVGATPEYLAGHYILQGGASFVPVMSLDPRPGERVLDMCAAPGGKTTYIAALMRNRGILFANDASSERCQAVVGNAQRMGVVNMVLMCKDGRRIPQMSLNVDRVLLDAPCSGTGVISNDPSVKSSRGEEDVKRRSHLQKELILSAIDSCRVGGVVVYSTCSVLVEENEEVVDYALAKRKVQLVETGVGLGECGFVKFKRFRFHPSMSMTRRYYPHVHDLDGFFVAKLVRM